MVAARLTCRVFARAAGPTIISASLLIFYLGKSFTLRNALHFTHILYTASEATLQFVAIMSTSSDEAYDASLDEYILHHVILPPKLPQADDFNATYDKQVVHLLLASLQKLRSLGLTPRERDVCANVIDMLEATAQASDDRGEVRAEELLPLLQRISKKGQPLI